MNFCVQVGDLSQTSHQLGLKRELFRIARKWKLRQLHREQVYYSFLVTLPAQQQGFDSNFKPQHKISWKQASQNKQKYLGIYNFVYVSVEKTWQTYYSAVDLLSSVVGRVQYIVNPSWLMSKVFSKVKFEVQAVAIVEFSGEFFLIHKLRNCFLKMP